jgi:hypothetical protein
MLDGGYFIHTDIGRIWSNKQKGQWLSHDVNYNGYQYVMLWHKGKSFKYYMHELVAYEVFNKAIVDITVNHRDGSPNLSPIKTDLKRILIDQLRLQRT